MFVAVKGELSEGLERRGEDSGGKGAPEVAPAGEERLWVRDAVKEHGQLETPQGCEEGPESARIKGGKVPNAQVVQGEGCQLGWYMDPEAGCESAKDRCLESEAIAFHPLFFEWIKRQVDSLEPGQLVNARNRIRQFVDDLSSN